MKDKITIIELLIQWIFVIGTLIGLIWFILYFKPKSLFEWLMIMGCICIALSLVVGMTVGTNFPNK